MRKSVLAIAAAVALLIVLPLSACGVLMAAQVPEKKEAQAQVEDADSLEEKSGMAGRETAEEEKESVSGEAGDETEDEAAISAEDDAQAEELMFRSGASTIQMEITTGLTTEYLDYVCSYPVVVIRHGEKSTIKDKADLDKMGLENLYTDALLAAVENIDIEKLEIKDKKAVLGDDKNYVVIQEDDNGFVGITEFHIE